VHVAFLGAADERAGRVYERVGFRPFATALAYAR
jgi:predicted GNAT family acetyltransferase